MRYVPGAFEKSNSNVKPCVCGHPKGLHTYQSKDFYTFCTKFGCDCRRYLTPVVH